MGVTGGGEKGMSVFHAEGMVYEKPQDGKEERKHSGRTERMVVNYWGDSYLLEWFVVSHDEVSHP